MCAHICFRTVSILLLTEAWLRRMLNFWPKFEIHIPFLVSLGVAVAVAKSLQSCPTLCDPTDGSPLGSSVPGILQARILEWVAISFSNA